MNIAMAPATRPLDERGFTVRSACAFALIAIVLTGLVYPLATAALGERLFPWQAKGSVLVRDGREVGSALVAQPFADARYFIPRPSAAGYAGASLAGSNWAPSNPALRERIATAAHTIGAREGIAMTEIPVDLVTASGGGWDPHVSPAGAAVQIARVAQARGLPVDTVRALVALHTQGRTFGVLGEPRVDVLRLNLALDAAQGAPAATAAR